MPQLSGNVRQPNHVLANEIAGHKAERRPQAGEAMFPTRSTSAPQNARCLAGKGDVVVDFLHVIAIVEHA